MRPEFTIAQLTDPHIGADWIADPSGALAAAVATVRTVLHRPPDCAVITGDIADDATDSQYAEARALLDRLEAPLYVLPGNHDDRDGLRRHFDLGAGTVADVGPAALLNYAADLGPVRLVALDTKRDGSEAGQLDGERLAWLDGALGEDRANPTLVALHHPPLVTGVDPADAIGLSVDERNALANVLSGHSQVQLVAGGHTHRTAFGALAGTPVMSLASTADQLMLDFTAEELRISPEPPCVAIHALIGGRLVTHIQPVFSDGRTPPETP